MKIPTLLERDDFVCAAGRGDIESLKAHIANGMPIDSIGDGAHSALIAASLKGFIDIAEYLISCGANINYRSRCSWASTAILAACTGRHTKLIHFLMENGAHPRISDGAGNSAGHRWIYGITENNEDIQPMLEKMFEHGLPVNQVSNNGDSLLIAALRPHMPKNLLDFLIANGADVNVQINNGLRSIHVACMVSPSHAIKSLLNAGADFNAVDRDGNTPAFLFNNELNPFDIFSYGPDLSIFNNQGETALTFQLKRTSNKDSMPIEIIKLIEAGADVNQKNLQGETIRDIAKKKKMPGVLNYLNSRDACDAMLHVARSPSKKNLEIGF